MIFYIFFASTDNVLLSHNWRVIRARVRECARLEGALSESMCAVCACPCPCVEFLFIYLLSR